jgi:hypothetical protein
MAFSMFISRVALARLIFTPRRALRLAREPTLAGTAA